MENTKRVPFFIPVAAIVIFALMFVYAAFFDHSFPEKAVKGFYQSYFSQDYQGAAEHISTLLTAKLVPEYATGEVTDHEAITAALAGALQDAAGNAPSTDGLKITILKKGIVKGTLSALVAFSISDESEEAGSTAVALLVKEGSGYKLVDAGAIDPSYVDRIGTADMSYWDEYFEQ